jgi:hypothetical protein
MSTPPSGMAAVEEPPAAPPPPAPVEEPAAPEGLGPKTRLALFGLALVVVAALSVFVALKLVLGG